MSRKTEKYDLYRLMYETEPKRGTVDGVIMSSQGWVLFYSRVVDLGILSGFQHTGCIAKGAIAGTQNRAALEKRFREGRQMLLNEGYETQITQNLALSKRELLGLLRFDLDGADAAAFLSELEACMEATG
jgi:hypothetical protein